MVDGRCDGAAKQARAELWAVLISDNC